MVKKCEYYNDHLQQPTILKQHCPLQIIYSVFIYFENVMSDIFHFYHSSHIFRWLAEKGEKNDLWNHWNIQSGKWSANYYKFLH